MRFSKNMMAFVGIVAVSNIAAAAGAAQFESVIDAMAIRTSDEQTNNAWEDISKIKDVKWRWPYYESGAHDSTMVGETKVGKDKNPNIGATEITVSGMRTMIASVQISVYNMSVDIKSLGKGKATRIKTSCDDDAPGNAIAFYRFEKHGYKPLYIGFQSSHGAGDSGSVDINVTYTLDEVIRIYSFPCEVLQ